MGGVGGVISQLRGGRAVGHFATAGVIDSRRSEGVRGAFKRCQQLINVNLRGRLEITTAGLCEPKRRGWW